jgi:hypothetical protein
VKRELDVALSSAAEVNRAVDRDAAEGPDGDGAFGRHGRGEAREQLGGVGAFVGVEISDGALARGAAVWGSAAEGHR